MKLYHLKLAAGESHYFACSGSYFRVLDCQGFIDVSFRGNGVSTDVREGLGFKISNFDGFTLNSPLTQTIVVVAGHGEVEDNSMSGNVDSVILSPSSFMAVPSVTLVATVAGELVATNSDRERVILKADIGNSQNVFIGDSGMVSGEGLPLAPGEVLEIKTTAEIYGLSTATDTIHISEVQR